MAHGASACKDIYCDFDGSYDSLVLLLADRRQGVSANWESAPYWMQPAEGADSAGSIYEEPMCWEYTIAHVPTELPTGSVAAQRLATAEVEGAELADAHMAAAELEPGGSAEQRFIDMVELLLQHGADPLGPFAIKSGRASNHLPLAIRYRLVAAIQEKHREFKQLSSGAGGPTMLGSSSECGHPRRHFYSPCRWNCAVGAAILCGMDETALHFVRECYLELGDEGFWGDEYARE